MSEPTSASPADVTARAGRYYRNARYLLVAGVVIFGILCIRDGFFRWPAINAHDRETGHDKVTYSPLDILINEILGVGLPPAGILFLIHSLHKSRGEIRLSGQTLSVPGHPPIEMDAIESLDKSQWDRKGVAVISYRAADGRTCAFKLDDFVYDRDGIDEIYRRIEQSFQEPQPEKEA